ncbi:MAG TPA: alcohol dehydrogenase catalytic domain-containing protein [Candidatus Binataceae bacterium]|nr:alcohol dehydrogenase catalytic domain-containing protein [Candidatus Binataceae bacterium]
MRALFFDGELKLVNDYPEPAQAAGESIVAVSLAGICGTDREILRGYMGYRGVPGHEFAGRVTHSDDPSMIGARVVGEINAGCGDCDACRAQLQRHCRRRTVLGILGRDGAFAERLSLPDANLHRLPDTVSDEAAVMVEPIAAAGEILDQVELPTGGGVLILGDGRLAAIVAMVLSGAGYAVAVAGRHREKLARIAALDRAHGRIVVYLDGADERRTDRYRIVIDCTGNSAGFTRALELVEPRGTIVLKSTAAAGAALNLAPVVINEITVVGSRCGRFAPAIEWLAAGRFDPRPLIDGVYPLDESRAAFAAAAESPKFKILLRPA